ncbi:hypothetical protein [Pedobacter panaciterrae]
MKKIFFISLFFISALNSMAQCTVANANEIKLTCKVLSSLVMVDLKNNDYDKVLASYLTYTRINQLCQIPQETKDFMNTLYKANRKHLDQLQVGLNTSSTKIQSNKLTQSASDKPYKSSMPFIVETTN